MNLQLPTIDEIKEASKAAFQEALREELPKAIRKASRKPYLTTKDLKEDYGFSYEKQSYMRNEQGLGYIKSGRKILYPIESFEKWANDHSVNVI